MSQPLEAPPVLGFSDHKLDGRYVVGGPQGRPLAWIHVPFWGKSFAVTTPDGQPLCAGSRAGVFSPTWTTVDTSGRVLATMRASSARKQKTTLGDGRELRAVGGSWFGRDWSLVDADGTTLLSSVPLSSSWSFHPNEWLVQILDPTLDLAVTVAVVQMRRMVVKAQQAAAASA